MVTVVCAGAALASLLVIVHHLGPAQRDTPDPRLGRHMLAIAAGGWVLYYVTRMVLPFITDATLLMASHRTMVLTAVVALALQVFGFHATAHGPLTHRFREWWTHREGERRWDLYLAELVLVGGGVVAVIGPVNVAIPGQPVAYYLWAQWAIAAVVAALCLWLWTLAAVVKRQLGMSPPIRALVRYGIFCTMFWLVKAVLCDIFFSAVWAGWRDVGLALDAVIFTAIALSIRANGQRNPLVQAIDTFSAGYLHSPRADAMVVVAMDGMVRAANRAAEALLGRSPDELVGRPAAAVLSEDQWRLANPRELLIPARSDDVLMERTTADGTRQYLASRVVPLTDPMGNEVGRAELLQDVTAYQEAQLRLAEYSHRLEERIAERSRALADSESRYRGLVDHLADCLLIVQDDTVRFANPAAQAIWKGRPRPVLGVDVGELWDGGVSSPWAELRARLAEAPTVPWRGSMLWTTDTDTEHEFLVTASAARWGDRDAVLLVGRDHSEQQELERSMDHVRRLQALGTLTGGIAHDFNNYLTSILGRLSMLQELTADDSAAAAQVAGALEAADKGQALISRLMRFSRPDHTGREATDLCQLLRETQALLHSLLRADVRVEWQIPSTPLWAEVESSGIQEILLNLAKNAEDAMADGGGGMLVITARAVAGSTPPVVQVRVTDTGTGITPDAMSRLFVPFFTTKPVGQGHGLGLALAHQIMQEHEGTIEVESAPDRGATFTLTLPQCPPPTGIAPAVPDLAVVEGGGELVVVVDDDADVRQTACDMLDRLGYQVATAANGRIALEVIAERKNVAAVLMDLVMPEMNGVDCALELKNLGFAAPIIFMTGYDPDPQRLRKLGANVVALRKPFRLKQLGSLLREEIAATRTAA